MELSLFLARVIGLYCVIVGFAYIFKRHFFRQVMEEYFDNRSVVLISAILALIVGLLLVVGHPVWEMSWRVIITLFGYLSLLKGILLLYSPKVMKKMTRALTAWDGLVFSGLTAITLIIGAYLIYQGFFTFFGEYLSF